MTNHREKPQSNLTTQGHSIYFEFTTPEQIEALAAFFMTLPPLSVAYPSNKFLVDHILTAHKEDPTRIAAIYFGPKVK